MSRLGSDADVLFDPVVVEYFALAAQEGHDEIGLRGKVENDGNGDYYRIKGIGNPEIGMLFVSEEGSELTDPMIERFRSNMQKGIIVVVDRYEQSFAFYCMDGDCCRTAKALLSE